VTPQLLRFGRSQVPVVVIDGFSGNISAIRAIAAAMAPFPEAENYYPGLRRIIGEVDSAAMAYVDDSLRRSAVFLAGGFGAKTFGLLQASFSIVTTPSADLTAVQRAPHFDSIEPKYIALLHYLSDTPGTGTAFYRHRATGVERVDATNMDRFLSAAKDESSGFNGYIQGSNPWFEEIGRVEAVPDRMVIYQGALLHSGIIPPDMPFSVDPSCGRLTSNIFVRIH
jgi:hypothetical protein